jgi:hypothetical protein
MEEQLKQQDVIEVAAPAKKSTWLPKYRDTRKTKAHTKALVYDSDVCPPKADAKKILATRGIKNAHVTDCVYGLLLQAAEQTGVVPNRFLFANGVVQTLKSYEAKEAQPLTAVPDEPVVGELISRSELHALYDASIAWREELSFDEFLRVRHICKTDCFLLGRDVLGKDFAQCHRIWTDFFPRFNPDTLSPNYTQKQAIQWLASQSDTKNFLMLASRNSFKSSWSHIWLLSLILCLPDIRVLLVSETKPLSKDFIGAMRGYFETTSGHETRFQQLFAEYCMPIGDGSALSLDCPMARLRLPQSIESTSMDSAVAGRRADVILFDDCISSTSCGNETQRQASLQKHDALLKLREVGGLALVLGTPWHEEDLYATLIKRNDANADKPLAYRIDPAFTVKREARHKLTAALLPTLVESDIESFLFPERLNWKWLRSEIIASPSFFLSQNLCIFPKDADADLKVTFEEDDLIAHTRPIGFFESASATTVMSVDRAFSVSQYADYSCVTVGRIMQRDRKTICVVTDVRMERWKESQLVHNIAEMIDRHRPLRVVIEKDKGWENLGEAIRRAVQFRGIPMPHFIWKNIPAGGHNARAKAKRIKILELPLADDRLWFVSSATWNDSVFAQFIKFDGITPSNSHRKDDAIDAVSLLYETFMPKDWQTAEPSEQEKRDKEAEQELQRERMRQHHRQMFGDDMPYQKPAEPEPQRRQNPMDSVFGNNGLSVGRRRW